MWANLFKQPSCYPTWDFPEGCSDASEAHTAALNIFRLLLKAHLFPKCQVLRSRCVNISVCSLTEKYKLFGFNDEININTVRMANYLKSWFQFSFDGEKWELFLHFLSC